MEAHEINKKWGGQMMTSLNIQSAAVVCVFGIKKDGQIAVSMTSDVANHLHKEILIKASNILQEQILKMQ